VQVNEFGRGVNFGVYAEVVAEGVVRVGDPLSVPPGSPREPDPAQPPSAPDRRPQ